MKKHEDEHNIQHINTKNEKHELMVNIEGICNNLKGTTRLNRFSFSLDIRKLPLTVFLTEIKLLVRNREFKKNDIILFYDDTVFRTGNRGFGITRDEVVTNMNGLFKVFRFQEMDQEPEFIKGHHKNAFRLFQDETSFDIKIKKHTKYTETVFDVLKLLYQYSRFINQENNKAYRVVSK